jgi:hypothetical protein
VLATEKEELQSELDALSEVLCPKAPCTPNTGCIASHAECSDGLCRTIEGAADAGDAVTADAGGPDGG